MTKTRTSLTVSEQSLTRFNDEMREQAALQKRDFTADTFLNFLLDMSEGGRKIVDNLSTIKNLEDDAK